MSVKVSIIVPIYNVERYLDRCIESLAEQTYTNIEIILINDGSTDGSLNICKKWEKIDHRIVLIDQQNSGVSVARNHGISISKGCWICFVDGDDYAAPDMIENLINRAAQSDCDICISDYFVDRDGKTSPASFIYDKKDGDTYSAKELITNAMVGNNREDNMTCVGVPWAKIYKKSFIINNNLNFIRNLKRNQDVVFNLYAFEYANRVTYCKRCLYYYRVWAGSAVSKYMPDYTNTIEKVMDEFYKFFNEINDDELKELCYKRQRDMYYEGLRLSVFHPDNKNGFLEKYRVYKKISYSKSASIRKCPLRILTKPQKIQSIIINLHLTFVSFLMLYVKNYIRQNSRIETKKSSSTN